MNTPEKSFLKRQQGLYWIWYIIPALVIYAVFMAYPLLDSLRLSFYEGSAHNRAFVGLQNYITLFTNPTYTNKYINAFRNTWVLFGIHMLVQNVLGILFAVLLTAPHFRGRNIYQTIIFAPTTFAVLVTGYLWKLLLNPLWSKSVLDAMGMSFLAKPWLGMNNTALIAVSLVSCWQWVGIPTMIFVTALQNISEDIYEAADIEGANPWQVFWNIKLPLISPVVGIIAVLTFVGNFNAFDIVFSMENFNGAPNFSTDLIGTLFYRYGIAGQSGSNIPEPGMGAAVATITFVMLAFVSFAVLKLTKTKE